MQKGSCFCILPSAFCIQVHPRWLERLCWNLACLHRVVSARQLVVQFSSFRNDLDRKRPIRPLFLLSGVVKMSALPERVEREIEKIVASEGLELVQIEYRKQGHGYLLRV